MQIERTDKVDLARNTTKTWRVNMDGVDALAICVRADTAGATFNPTIAVNTYITDTAVAVTVPAVKYPHGTTGNPNVSVTFNANMVGMVSGTIATAAIIAAGGWCARFFGAVSDSNSALHITKAIYPIRFLDISVTTPNVANNTFTGLQLISFVEREEGK